MPDSKPGPGSSATTSAARPGGCGGWTAGWRLGWAGRAAGDPADLSRLSADAAAVGVTGWTDATPERSERDTEVLLGRPWRPGRFASGCT